MKDDTSAGTGQPEGGLTRLRDVRAGDLEQDAAWAVDLLREAPPHRLKPGERQRVLLGLGRAHPARSRRWAVRLAATVAVLVMATAAARAGLGHLPRWLTGLARGLRPSPPTIARPVTGVSRPRELAAAPAAPGPAPAITSQPAPPPEASPANEPHPALPTTPPARRPAARADRGDGDAGLVVHATRALHRDGDPALARSLSAAYLQRHPDGPLAEEALALTIEAALVQQQPDAPALGARYLQRYPNGPFRGLAGRASRLGTTSPR